MQPHSNHCSIVIRLTDEAWHAHSHRNKKPMHAAHLDSNCNDQIGSLKLIESTERRRRRSAEGARRDDASASAELKPQQEATRVQESAETPPYAKLATQTANRLQELHRDRFRVTNDPFPVEYQNRISGNGKFTLTSQAWTIARNEVPTCDVRCVLIRGSKNTIINTWVFPYRPKIDPVFAAELIAFGGLPRLAFLDVQVPGMRLDRLGNVGTHVAKICREFPELRITETPPEWAVAATTGNYLFTREGTTELYAPIGQAYMRLLDCYLDLISDSDSDAPAPDDNDISLKLLGEYQVHHMEHSPGKVFLSKLFGESWTDSFMSQFLFSLPGGNA